MLTHFGFSLVPCRSDTLEQIDIAKLLINKYPDVSAYISKYHTFRVNLYPAHRRLATRSPPRTSRLQSAAARLPAFSVSRGTQRPPPLRAPYSPHPSGHQLGNSLQVLRQYQELGVRYVTLTHACHNAFADSCGIQPGLEPRWGGLSAYGRALVEELNRLGVLVDLSHTSDDTAKQALRHSKAPVIWSHSSARAVHDVPRNVPDDVLELIGTGPNQTDAVVMVRSNCVSGSEMG